MSPETNNTKSISLIWITMIIGFAILGAKIKGVKNTAEEALYSAGDAGYDARNAADRVDQACWILNNGC